MKTNQHTPGPWIVKNGDVHAEQYGLLAAVRYLGNSQSQKNEREFNARLIASAPDLLEALKTTLAMLELLNAPGTNDPIEARVYQARAAIAKATGQESEVAK